MRVLGLLDLVPPTPRGPPYPKYNTRSTRPTPAKCASPPAAAYLLEARPPTAAMIGAFSEQLITIDELRNRMPDLRAREANLRGQLTALDAQAADRDACLKLADNLESFLAQLRGNAATATTEEEKDDGGEWCPKKVTDAQSMSTKVIVLGCQYLSMKSVLPWVNNWSYVVCRKRRVLRRLHRTSHRRPMRSLM